MHKHKHKYTKDGCTPTKQAYGTFFDLYNSPLKDTFDFIISSF